MTKDREEFKEKQKMVKSKFPEDASYIISEYIQDVQSTLDCGFYVTKTGRIIYIGVEECAMEDLGFRYATIDWNKQDQYKAQLYEKFVVPVANYLHKKGYFGIVGIDVVTSESGDYLVDLNSRINGNTSYLMLARSMASKFTKSFFDICLTLDGAGDQLVKKANSLNETNEGGRVIIMAVADDGMKCHATVAVFGDSVDLVDSLFAQLCGKE